jgi:alpha-tubulin suppressor-like RCC1 family protein
MKSISNRLLLILTVFLLLGGGIGQLFAQTRTVSSAIVFGQSSYFVLDDGTLYAANAYPYSDTASAYPKKITTGVKSVYAGSNHFFFLKTNGTLWAVGDNSYGQLADGTQTTQGTPVQIATDVISVSSGNTHALFIKSDNTMWAAGLNRSGQFGTGYIVERPTLNPVRIMTSVKEIAAGTDSSFL